MVARCGRMTITRRQHADCCRRIVDLDRSEIALSPPAMRQTNPKV
jgi:hypothetical protein